LDLEDLMDEMNIGPDQEEDAKKEVEENDDIDDLIAKMEKVTIEKPEEMKKWSEWEEIKNKEVNIFSFLLILFQFKTFYSSFKLTSYLLVLRTKFHLLDCIDFHLWFI